MPSRTLHSVPGSTRIPRRTLHILARIFKSMPSRTLHFPLGFRSQYQTERRIPSPGSPNHNTPTVGLDHILLYLLSFFCQAHHCGAFIQKHSSIVTVFLSLLFTRLCMVFVPHMYIPHYNYYNYNNY